MADNVPLCLLYLFVEDDELYVYQGFLPLDIGSPDVEIFGKIPRDVQMLYAVHDGWVFALDQKMGHLPHDRWYYLSRYWGHDGELINQVPVDMCNTLVVAKHANGDALCFEAKDDHFVAVKWWWDDPGEPEFDVDFWYEYDEWMEAELEDCDDSSLA